MPGHGERTRRPARRTGDSRGVARGRQRPCEEARKGGPRRPRYPQVRVSLTSRNPLAWIAAVREELRLAKADAEEVRRFSDQALAALADPGEVRRVVEEWVGQVGAG